MAGQQTAGKRLMVGVRPKTVQQHTTALLVRLSACPLVRLSCLSCLSCLSGCIRRFRQVLLAEEDFAAGRDLCATGLIKPAAIFRQLHTWFALRQYENPFRQKGPALAVNRDYTLLVSPRLMSQQLIRVQAVSTQVGVNRAASALSESKRQVAALQPPT